MIILSSVLSLIGLIGGSTGLAMGQDGAWTFIILGLGIGLGIITLLDLETRKHHD